MSQTHQARDSEPEHELRKRLGRRSLLECVELSVSVRHGVAYLEGSVPNVAQKKTIGEVAATVHGIREVVNMLRVAPMAIVNDDTLEARLGRALAANTTVDEARFSLDVANGHVHISGLARSSAERCAAEDEVWAVAGVRGVTTEIEVLFSGHDDSRDVPHGVAQGMAQYLGLNPETIGVDFSDGTVRLRGVVASDYHRVAVEELAYWLPPVTDVVNELRVASPQPAALVPGVGGAAGRGIAERPEGIA